MIRSLVDFAINNRIVVLIVGVLLATWGVISFHNLPVEAYPDIADNYVTVITQWPGRASEEVEQQVTIPVESDKRSTHIAEEQEEDGRTPSPPYAHHPSGSRIQRCLRTKNSVIWLTNLISVNE